MSQEWAKERAIKYVKICRIIKKNGLCFASTYDYNTLYKIFFDRYAEFLRKTICLKKCGFCYNLKYKYFTSNLQKAYLFITNNFTFYKEKMVEWKLYRIKNTIYFNGIIPCCLNFASKFCRLLNEIEQSDEDKIIIDINSPGGDIGSSIYISNHIHLYIKKEILGYSFYKCSSAAILIYLACNVRYMSRESTCFIHKPFYQNPKFINEELPFDTLFLIKYYHKKMKCNIKTIEELFKGKGRYVTPEEALEIGMCHHIIN